MDILAPLEDLAQQLREAGLSAGVDPTKLNPPCAWVHCDRFEVDTLAGGGTLHAQIDLTVPSWKLSRAMAELGEMLDLALSVVTPDGQVQLDTGIELENKTILPGFRIPVNLEI
ncbi:hypothetical protein [Microbacterium sp. NPDC087665]|uniref:hypothetical protein n=1 Tax=Microbacterium sp. NPDC087665 TaxID=3364194 RepID=UPI0037FADD66